MHQGLERSVMVGSEGKLRPRKKEVFCSVCSVSPTVKRLLSGLPQSTVGRGFSVSLSARPS